MFVIDANRASPPGDTPAILVEDLEKTYVLGLNAVPALRGVSLKVMAGEFVAVVGASGSGKSTLMHILGCLDILSQGSCHIGGVDVSEAGDDELSRLRNQKIGFVFQQFNLLPDLSVVENIALPLAYRGVAKRDREQQAIKLAEELGLGDRLDHTPLELSGGQAQRVAIVYRAADLGLHLYAVHVRPVRAVQVQDVPRVPLVDQPGVTARHSAIHSAVRRHIHVRVDATHLVLSPDQQLRLVDQGDMRAALDHFEVRSCDGHGRRSCGNGPRWTPG